MIIHFLGFKINYETETETETETYNAYYQDSLFYKGMVDLIKNEEVIYGNQSPRF